MAASITMQTPYAKTFIVGHIAFDGASASITIPLAKVDSFRISMSDSATSPIYVLSGATVYAVAAAGSTGGSFIAEGY